MRRCLIMAAAFWLLLPGPAFPSTCVECHRDLEDEMAAPVALVEQDVHGRNGISCHDCHGGDPEAGLEEGDPELAMDPAKGYIGIPSPRDIPRLCGGCHSDAAFMKIYNPQASVDQEQLYWTSEHGKQLRNGDRDVATCTSCHRAHSIHPPGDPRSSVYPSKVPETCGSCHGNAEMMALHGKGTEAVIQYRRSVHGVALLENRDLAAPACNDCHGNHGAAPPGAASAAHVCGLCHAHQANLFYEGNHGEVFDEAGLPGCVACHGNHAVLRLTDEMLGSGTESVCARCHEDGSEGLEAAALMRASLEDLRGRIAYTESLLAVAEQHGLDVDAPKFDLREGSNSLTMARGLVHRFSPGEIQEVAAEGAQLIGPVEEAARELMRDRRNRRIGLAVTSFVILLLVLGLWLKIREIEARRGKTVA